MKRQIRCDECECWQPADRLAWHPLEGGSWCWDCLRADFSVQFESCDGCGKVVPEGLLFYPPKLGHEGCLGCDGGVTCTYREDAPRLCRACLKPLQATLDAELKQEAAYGSWDPWWDHEPDDWETRQIAGALLA